MTRRIATAILLTVWATLIAGGLIAYFTIRSILLANLDETLKNRAIAVVESSSRRSATGPATQPASLVVGGHRSVTKDDSHRAETRLPPQDGRFLPRIINAHFSSAAETRMRTVTVRCYVARADARGEFTADNDPKPVTTTISDTAAPFDELTNRLSVRLGLFGIVAGLLAAGVAVVASRIALRPLRATAARIGSIDERNLDRRVDTTLLPPELLPMAATLNAMLARLQDAFALRNRFIADASHELRTPVASLATALDVALSRPRDADAYRGTLERCREDAVQLRELVERLMEQVRSESLSHDEPAVIVDVACLLRQCVDNISPLADVKDVSMRSTFESGLTAFIAPHRFRGIVTNLLGNAIEYNRSGGRVDVACARVDGFLELSVDDTGMGIAPEHLPHLFEAFYRADVSRQRESGHLGLGLSLVDSHVKAMSGTCEVTSEVGVGTTFRIRIPQPN